MNQATGWAIFNRHDEPVLGSVSPTKPDTLAWWLAPYPSKKERRAAWRKFKRQGFSIRKVVVQEETDA